MAGRLVHSVAGVALAATMVAVGGVPASAAADDPSSRQDESRLQLQTTGAVLDYGGAAVSVQWRWRDSSRRGAVFDAGDYLGGAGSG